jgi:hypothetical protein
MRCPCEVCLTDSTWRWRSSLSVDQLLDPTAEKQVLDPLSAEPGAGCITQMT